MLRALIYYPPKGEPMLVVGDLMCKKKKRERDVHALDSLFLVLALEWRNGWTAVGPIRVVFKKRIKEISAKSRLNIRGCLADISNDPRRKAWERLA